MYALISTSGGVDTRNPHAVFEEVDAHFRIMFPEADTCFIERAFSWICDCFGGRFPGYRAIDARYHDLEHTMQGTLCLARLLRGRQAVEALPRMSPHHFQLGLLAILLHDTGYLKETQDVEGTGAKYTLIHVKRSAEFAQKLLSQHNYSAADIRSVQNMIRCTGLNVDLTQIPFASAIDRQVGFALGTADLLAQMAAPDYVEKLPILYLEFAEAALFSRGRQARGLGFQNADELVAHTPAFWRHYVIPKINEDFAGLYRFLNDPYPDGPNAYLNRIQENVMRLEGTVT